MNPAPGNSLPPPLSDPFQGVRANPNIPATTPNPTASVAPIISPSTPPVGDANDKALKEADLRIKQVILTKHHQMQAQVTDAFAQQQPFGSTKASADTAAAPPNQTSPISSMIQGIVSRRKAPVSQIGSGPIATAAPADFTLKDIVTRKELLDSSVRLTTEATSVTSATGTSVTSSTNAMINSVVGVKGKEMHVVDRNLLTSMIKNSDSKKNIAGLQLQREVVDQWIDPKLKTSIELQGNRSNLFEQMDKAKMNDIFKSQRIALSKTVQRYPAEVKKWALADEEVRKMAKQKGPITEAQIKKLQQTINRIVGWLPEVNSPIDREKEFTRYVSWFNEKLEQCESGLENPIVVSAQAYQYCLSLHLFHDGNGRLGRLMMDFILQRSGLPPAVFFPGANQSMDSLVYDLEHNINFLIQGIKDSTLLWCKTLKQPSPFTS